MDQGEYQVNIQDHTHQHGQLQNSRSRFILTSNHGFASYAQEEIKRLIPNCRFQILLPTEVLLLEVEASKQGVLSQINGNEPVFLRHIQPVDQSWNLDDWLADIHCVGRWLNEQDIFQAGNLIATQVRVQDKSVIPYQPSEIKNLIEQILLDKADIQSVTRHATWTISLYISTQNIYVGISKPQENISDWSGGAIRFMREENQVSRAKFKLLEAEYVFDLVFHATQEALDVGAAPGGWTSLLLERGMRVTAIDPAEMHESLTRNTSLTYYKKNASDVKIKANRFDWLVCDMSFSPRQSIPIVLQLVDTLKPTGCVILTVKLMHKKPFQSIREVLGMLDKQLQLIQAKQLFHNREEITMYFKKL
jgi:23S rRNA (cytidine2498-2'-O)-methyltransferase